MLYEQFGVLIFFERGMFHYWATCASTIGGVGPAGLYTVDSSSVCGD